MGVLVISVFFTFVVFAILYNWPPLPLRTAPSRGGSGSLSNTWFLRPTRVHNLKDISISSAVFAGLTIVTDRPTDRQTTLLCL